ncbi:MAG: polysaccharide pyruvyl transferase family protein [Inquilinus limosus]|uniref:Polysaccharide pyruvyl transferase family protein n=1 Tax=Inquilinus limosus TaxID=171674 RepID=A0A952FN62_9PROT|nr:polysaccharide pyruvyl transferase family protein [Inquilinus limosus]
MAVPGNETIRALATSVRERQIVPLTWVAATREQDYVNLGDALSSVMVALLAGLPVEHVAHESRRLRMAAVGTIGHSLKQGEVVVWGTGSSRWRNPSAPAEERVAVAPLPGTRLHIAATRGPVSRRILGEENAVGPAVYGDPVWLLPKFHPAPQRKKWKLGVIIHLADLQDRSFEVRPKAEHVRYQVPAELAGDVRLIHTVTPIGLDGMRARLDEILECERIVSTSLHGMVFAESYGIPCLYFSPRAPRGLHTAELDPDGTLDLRIVDLYRGLGLSHIPVYGQPRRERTDWATLMAAIDKAWAPPEFDTNPLLEAFPLDLNPLQPRRGQSVFEHPVLRQIPLQHRPQTVIRPTAAAVARPTAVARPATGPLRRMAALLRRPLTDRA